LIISILNKIRSSFFRLDNRTNRDHLCFLFIGFYYINPVFLSKHTEQ